MISNGFYFRFSGYNLETQSSSCYWGIGKLKEGIVWVKVATAFSYKGLWATETADFWMKTIALQLLYFSNSSGSAQRMTWWWLPTIYLCVPKSCGISVRTIAPLSCVSGIWQWSIGNLVLAVDTLQWHSLCKLSLVSFNCHFIYFVMQLTAAVALNCPCLLSFAQYFLPIVTVLDRPHLIRGCWLDIPCHINITQTYRGQSSAA